MITAEAHTLTGAYALDAVTDLERAAFDRHLAECPTCAREVAEFRETAALLGLAMTTESTTRLRSRVLTAAATTRQVPPTVGTATRTGRSWRKRIVVVVGGIAAAAAVLAGGISIGAQQSEPAPTAQVAEPAGVANAPDAQVLRADGADGGSAVVTFSRQQGEALVTAQSLPPLEAGRAYQVWIIGPHGARSAGVLHTGSGSVTTPLPAEVDRVGVTAEPAAGSAQPTTPAVVRVPLA
ncbi:anti-sigma factor domain-containing protein [Amycolatopsis sp. NPDC088138]|uniref:anti-sigma factor n=1 Tax=Amycolatopsis sp. NPDC088138 TaxID=3363938 RepID=UPI00381A2E52